MKSVDFNGFWSERGDSNSWPDEPKPMSEPSSRTFAPSLALPGAPAIPLWNSFALFVSGTAFAFWDLCGIKFCILKALPTGFTSASSDSITENTSEIAPHKQGNKPRRDTPSSQRTENVIANPKTRSENVQTKKKLAHFL